MNASHLRAQVYFRQARYDRAEAELAQALADDPHDAYAHSLLAFCLSARRKYTDATREAEMAVHHAPDNPFSHYALAHVLEDRNLLDAAQKSIREAIRLDPHDADHLSFLAHLEFRQRNWSAALAEAERALGIDPQHTRAANVKALALTQLGRQAEADATLAHALRESPDDADAHAAKGWTLLQQNQHAAARHHFREALRIDPDMEWARLGMVEAIKAKSLFYRVMLKYMFWMSRLSSGRQWTVVIGAYLIYRVVLGAARKFPEWAPVLWPLVGLYIFGVIMTWIAKPLYNLLLQLSRDGRLALAPDERLASLAIGGCLAGSIVSGIIYAGNDSTLWFMLMVICAVLLIPVSSIFHCEPGWPRTVMALYTLALVLLAGVEVVCEAYGMPGVTICFPLFFVGVFASAFMGNILVQILPKRN